MELSPLAREKLASIGELTEEERTKLQYSEELTSLLAEYFTNQLSNDDLWKELKKHRDEGRGGILKDAQLRILGAMKLSSSDADITKLRQGLLAIETLKDKGDYSGLEHELGSILELRQQYREESKKTYDKIKADVERQVGLAVQQLAGQAASKGATIDVQSSVEATTKASPEWKSFSTRHDNTYSQRFKEHIEKLHGMLDS
ncbi:MAG: hypothetical protein PHI12_10060 [Dehalococcoidales bacterium]|nr:hypothetical protein [Dehalococcoidales bacterium]